MLPSFFPSFQRIISLKIKNSRIIRSLYITVGTISLGLAVLGIFLPGLPCTPFALLSGFFYAKSSKKLYVRLLNNKLLGPRIKSYQRKGGITRKGKKGIILFMTLMVLFSSFLIIQQGVIRILILVAGSVGVIVVWFIVPNAKEEDDIIEVKAEAEPKAE